MSHFFYHLYKSISINKLKAFIAFFALLLGLVYLSFQLNFEEDITKLIPENEKAATLNKVLDQVDFADKIVILLSSEKKGDVSDLTTLATKLIDSLQQNCSPYIKELQGVIEEDDFEETMDFVYDNIPLFLNKEDYKDIAKKTTPLAINKAVKESYKALISPSGFVTKNILLKDPLGISFLGLKKLKELQIGDNFTIKNGFIITKDEQHILLFIKPKLPPNETDKNTLFVSQLNRIKDNLNSEFTNKANVQYYGATVVAVANANQIKADIHVTVTIAMTVLFVILMLFYKKLTIPIILFIPTIFGALLAVSVLYVFRGTISAISIGIGSLLLGITLDYSLHILTHFRHNSNVKTLYKDVTKPIVMSSITTALAFLCLLFIKSRALQDLGIFAAVSVFGASFFALVLIPHLYKNKVEVIKKKSLLDKFSEISFEKNKIIVALCLLLFITSLFTYKKVLFDKDISKMNYQTEALLNTEKQLNDLINTHSKSLYIVAYGNELNAVLHENKNVYDKLIAYKKDGKIINFSSVASVILSKENQLKKVTNWKTFWSDNKQKQVQQNLIKSSTVFGFKTSAFSRFYKMTGSNYEALTLLDYKTIKALNSSEFISEKEGFYTVLSSLKVTEANIAAVKKYFEKQQNVLVIDRQAMNETFLDGFKDNFNKLLGFSFFVVVLVLWLFFKRIELVLITILPIALTWLVTLGIMGAIGLSFNIFNIIISTFIFGLGVDYAIFMTNGLIKEYETGKKQLPTYRVSIILSVITTVLGIGVLILAKHPALKSISVVTLIGIFTAVLITFTIQPIVFRACITNRAKKGLAPFTFRRTIHAILSFIYYGGGGFILSVIAVLFLKVIPLSKKIKFKWLHKIMSKLMTSVLYSNPFIKKRIVNKYKENFSKPALIIANHTSFLDTLVVGMLNPKVIYLVNDWVYKSAVFGLLARAVGYYPVSKGVDGSFEHLQNKIDQGYSIVVFPEGRRMLSNKIGRFKKGAFFLAEKLNLDILPVYIHGNAQLLPKNDMIIYNGSLTAVIGERIDIKNKNLGEDIKGKTKAISKIYKSEFSRLRGELEDAQYFKTLLLDNYLFKSEAIFTSVKKDIDSNLEKYYQLSKLIANDAKISHIANDYGQIDRLLIYNSNIRKIQTYIPNVSKRQIASATVIGQEHKIDYISDLNTVKKAEVLIISVLEKTENIIFENFETIVMLNQLEEIVLTNYSKTNVAGIMVFKKIIKS